MVQKDLFSAVVDESKLNHLFLRIRDTPDRGSAREMMQEVFSQFIDKDKSFVREFQTAGFSARVFELAMFAYFLEAGVELDQREPAPDFVVLGDNPVAVEVTTTNQAQGEVPNDLEFELLDLQKKKIIHEEFVFQAGKAIRRKLTKRDSQGRAYWNMPHVEGKPFLVALCAFHNQHAHFNPMGLLSEYLYGKSATLKSGENGDLFVEYGDIEKHRFNGREIPSALFRQPEAANLSGVLFSNSHTASMFTRIGAERGHAISGVEILRFGTAFDDTPGATGPKKFAYFVGERPEGQGENFTEGLHVLANPWASIKVQPEHFPGVPYHEILPDGRVVSTFQGGFHPFESQTILFPPGAKPVAELIRKNFLSSD